MSLLKDTFSRLMNIPGKIKNILTAKGTRKKPLLVLAVSVFWLGYTTTGLVQFFHESNKLRAMYNEKRLKQVDYQIYAATPLLVNEEIHALRQNLAKARALGEFNYYLLKKGDEVLAVSEDGQIKDFPIGPDQTPNQDFQAKTTVIGPYKLTIGVNHLGADFLFEVLKRHTSAFIRDLIIVTSFLALLLYLLLKDIIDLSKILRRKDRGGAQLIKVRTQEAETLVAVTSQFENVNRGLKLAHLTMAENVSPAVREELERGTQINTEFQATIVRVDLNGYTRIFLEKREDFVSHTLSPYFSRAAEIIGRYEGLIYQYVGDEIVFHFKGEEKKSLLMATACVRDLFALAEHLHEELFPEKIPFRLKSAMAFGKLRFVKLDRGYAFTGMPLIESVRMLGKIDDPHHNALVVMAPAANLVTELVQVEEATRADFKGFTTPTEIAIARRFIEVEETLKDRRYDLVPYFRGDSHLGAIFNFLAMDPQAIAWSDFLAIYRTLRSSSFGRVGGEAVGAYANLLKAVHEAAQTRAELTSMLSAVTSLGSQILRLGAIPDSVRRIFEQNLAHPDQRVRGNTILALDEISPEAYSFRDMFNQPFNRAAADALFAEGRREYSDEVHSFLTDFLNSQDPFFVASALYVMGELYEHHQRRDPVYFGANSNLKSIPRQVAPFLSHGNEMVRKRAEVVWHRLDEARGVA